MSNMQTRQRPAPARTGGIAADPLLPSEEGWRHPTIRRIAENDPTLTALGGHRSVRPRFRAGHAPALADALRSNHVVRVLCGNAFAGDEALAAFLSVAGRTGALRADAPPRVLDFHGLRVGDAGAAAIADILRGNSSPKKLNLEYCDISDDGAVAIADALARNRTLGRLDLRGNLDIGDGAASAFGITLSQSNSTLEELFLIECSIGDGGATALGGALSQNSGLKNLWLGSKNVGDSGAAALAHGLQNNKMLRELTLSGCPIGVEGLKSLAEGLRHNDMLQVLVLWNIPIDRDNAVMFANVLKFHNHSVERLYLSLRTAVNHVRDSIESYTKINKESSSSMEAYARKTLLFPKSHLGSLTEESAVLPSALQRLDCMLGILSVTFCFVRETHAALLGCRTVTGREERKKR